MKERLGFCGMQHILPILCLTTSCLCTFILFAYYSKLENWNLQGISDLDSDGFSTIRCITREEMGNLRYKVCFSHDIYSVVSPLSYLLAVWCHVAVT